MTSAQVVETSVNVISNSPSQDYTHPDDRTLLYDMTPGFKPFTIKNSPPRSGVAEKYLHIICISLNNKRIHCIMPSFLKKKIFDFS